MKHGNVKNFNDLSVKIGCDIVKVKRFEKISRESLLKIFHEIEFKNVKHETLAGMFAAKESCRKVFNDLRWHDMMITKSKNGKPILKILQATKINSKILSHDLSISHDGDYAMAIVVFLMLRKENVE